jgi:hypothetical protein
MEIMIEAKGRDTDTHAAIGFQIRRLDASRVGLGSRLPALS